MKATSSPIPINRRPLRLGGAVGGGAAGGGAGYAGGVGDPAGGGPGVKRAEASAELSGSFVTTSVREPLGHSRTDGSELAPTARRDRNPLVTRQYSVEHRRVIRRTAKPDNTRPSPTAGTGAARHSCEAPGPESVCRLGASKRRATARRDHPDAERSSENATTRGFHRAQLTSSSDVCLRAGFDSCKSRHVPKSGCGPEGELAVAAGRHRGRAGQIFDLSRPAMSGANTKPSALYLFLSRRQST